MLAPLWARLTTGSSHPEISEFLCFELELTATAIIDAAIAAADRWQQSEGVASPTNLFDTAVSALVQDVVQLDQHDQKPR